jgi:DeoR family suf operon transcriptional repressor
VAAALAGQSVDFQLSHPARLSLLANEVGICQKFTACTSRSSIFGNLSCQNCQNPYPIIGGNTAAGEQRMSNRILPADAALLDLLHRSGPMGVSKLSAALDVTSNAVRQRLTRLMALGLVQRTSHKGHRGRPAYRYAATDKARRQAGNNFADLALVLWQEIKAVPQPEVRRGLLQRLARSLARLYKDRVRGGTLPQRVAALAELFGERNVSLRLVESADATTRSQPEHSDADVPAADGSDPPAGHKAARRVVRHLPVITVDDCPYPDLAEQDRGICAVEKMLFSELLEENVQLTQCRLEGHTCCQFAAG